MTSEKRCVEEKDRQKPEAFWYQIEFQRREWRER